MTIEYHILIIPVFPWDDLKIEDLETFNKLTKIMDGLFKFQINPELQATNNLSIFSGRIAHVSHEVPYIYDITNAAKEANQKTYGLDLKIEAAYATKYAIELVSTSSDIYDLENNHQYLKICDNLSNLLYEGMDRNHCYHAAVVKLILCDNTSEVNAFASSSKLQKITNELYLEKRKLPPSGTHRVFNFRDDSWVVSSYLSNPIISLKPEKISDYKTTDELSFLLTVIHSLGKFYSITQSMKNISAALEVSLWSLSDVLKKYEAEFCWIQRNFQNIEKKLFEFEQEAREFFNFWGRPLESKIMVYREYGEDFLDLEWGIFQQVLTDERFQKYYTSMPDTSLEKSVLEEIKKFSEQLTEFWNEFNEVSKSWKENRRSIVEHHQILLSLIGIFAAIVSDVILRLVFPC